MYRMLVICGCLWCCAGYSQQVDSLVQEIKVKAHDPKIISQATVHVVMLSAYAASTFYCYRFADTRIQLVSQKTRNGFLTFISGAVTDLGLGKTQAIALASTSLAVIITRKKLLQQLVITWGGALVINSVATDEIKKTFQRHRPNTGDPYNVFDWRKGSGFHRSFASAHTSNAFTTATIFATIYKNHPWVPFVAYGVASLVGASRIYDNEHWASDVMAGAAIGFLSAKAMTAIYQKAAKKIHFLPMVSVGGGAINMVYQF